MRGDCWGTWLIMLGFMDLGWPRVCRRPTSVLYNLCIWYLSKVGSYQHDHYFLLDDWIKKKILPLYLPMALCVLDCSNSIANTLELLQPLISQWSLFIFRADSRFAPSQWEMALLCNVVSHWLGAKPRISPDIVCLPIIAVYYNVYSMLLAREHQSWNSHDTLRGVLQDRGNSLATNGFPSQKASNAKVWCFYYFSAVNPNNMLNNQLSCWWFEMPWHSCGITNDFFSRLPEEPALNPSDPHYWHLVFLSNKVIMCALCVIMTSTGNPILFCRNNFCLEILFKTSCVDFCNIVKSLAAESSNVSMVT